MKLKNKILIGLLSFLSCLSLIMIKPQAYSIDNNGNIRSDNLFNYNEVVYDNTSLISAIEYDNYYYWGFDYKVGNNTNIGQIMFRLYQNNNIVYTDTYNSIGTYYFNVLHNVTSWTNFSEFDLYIYRNGNNSDYGIRLNMGYLDDLVDDGVLYCSFNYSQQNIVGGDISSKIINLQLINDTISSYQLNFEPYGIYYSQNNYNNAIENSYNEGLQNLGIWSYCEKVTTDIGGSRIREFDFKQYLNNNNYWVVEKGILYIRLDFTTIYGDLEGNEQRCNIYFEFGNNVVNSTLLPNFYVSGDWSSIWRIFYYGNYGETFEPVNQDNVYHLFTLPNGYYLKYINLEYHNYSYTGSGTIAFDTSYNKGYIEGYENGSTNGFYEGYENAQNNYEETNNILRQENKSLKEQLENNLGWKSMAFAMADTPFKVVQNVLGFEVLGINLYKALIGLLTLLAIFWIFKKFRGD